MLFFFNLTIHGNIFFKKKFLYSPYLFGNVHFKMFILSIFQYYKKNLKNKFLSAHDKKYQTEIY